MTKARIRAKTISDTTPLKIKKPSKTQGKPRQKSTQDKRIKKRKREAEEKDLYISNAKRKGTSNRRERGSARERMPHVILADRLEQVRIDVEKRPTSIPFHKKVNKRIYPGYYEIITEPIDLQTIRDKIQRYEYKTADSFISDFDLMKKNAVKFNGESNIIAKEANEIYMFVNNIVNLNKAEFDEMEMAVKHQLNFGKKKSSIYRSSINKSSMENDTKKGPIQRNTANVLLDGVNTQVPIGNVDSYMLNHNSESDDSTSKFDR